MLTSKSLPFDLGLLNAWFSNEATEIASVIGVERFAGGQSNPTYRLATQDGTYVLRSKPAGDLLPGAHAIEREFAIISGLTKTGFPVPHPIAYCEDTQVIGTPFYIMSLVEGDIFWEAGLPTVEVQNRRHYFTTMAETLAQLHMIDPASIGLDGLGKKSGFIERQLKRWSGQYLGEELVGRNADMDWLIEWLGRELPQDRPGTLIHGDFRFDNAIFRKGSPEILAVLDWELSTLGDPDADLCYHLMMYHLPVQVIGGLAGRAVEGILSQKDFIDVYCDRVGKKDIGNIAFYLAFNMFRFAAILYGIEGRRLRGNASSPNAQALSRHMPLVASTGRKIAERSI